MRIEDIYKINTDIMLIHGIFAKGSLDSDFRNMTDRLENILSGNKISTQSVKIDSFKSFYCPIGIILENGDITGIFESDNGTLNYNSKPEMDETQLIGNIHIINSPPEEEYNEILARNVSIKSIYITCNNKDNDNLYLPKDIYEASQQKGLNVYFLNVLKNLTFSTEWNNSKNEFELLSEINLINELRM